ncbi:hypothetical protein, variant [Exophiala oligosperma]|uniref:Uncharacterized protein n=1 Tax=Exophiala oligosperma TaxID=215243 RepID=A0A0D2DVY9_9EURO|nr:hypothetical protein, variant [Exophiala oligosperma]KIW47258.1 hypothetical protein, variant [Exophiala oligosperma]
MASMTSKVAIIGIGQVGAATAYAILQRSLCSELIIVDTKTSLREAQVLDLSDASCCEGSDTQVRIGSYHEAGQCDIVIITADSRRTIGETTIQSLERKNANLRTMIDGMKPFNQKTILLIVSTPVDILTSVAQRISGLPTHQVIGLGTALDSVRLRKIISGKLHLASKEVKTYVLGEHGSFQFVPLSCVSIHGQPLTGAMLPKKIDLAGVAEECSVVADICSSVLLNRRDTWSVSHYQKDLDCCLSLPALIGRKGIGLTVELPLTAEDKVHLAKSGTSIKERVNWLLSGEEVSGMTM